MFLKYALKKKRIPKKIFELPQSTDSDSATLMHIFGRFEQLNLFIFTSHNFHHNWRFWGLRGNITLRGCNRFAILFSWNTMLVFWSNYSVAFFRCLWHPSLLKIEKSFYFALNSTAQNIFFFGTLNAALLSIPFLTAWRFFKFFPFLIHMMTPSASRHSGHEKKHNINLDLI